MLRKTGTFALGLVLVATPALHAQSASRVDLSGEWTGSRGKAGFSSKQTSGGADSYHVVVTRDGKTVEGTARFDGQRLALSTSELAGIIERLSGDTTNGPAQASSYDYQRDTGVDRLLSGSGDLERARPSAASSAPVWRKPTGAPSGSWGGRSQIEATVEQIDGVKPSHHWWSFATENPLVNKVLGWFKPGLSTKDEKKKLSSFVAQHEAAWGQAVTDLPPGSIKDYDLFRAQKAIALARFDRTPKDVTEGFIDAKGSVDGQAIAPRRIFWQRWKPIGKPSGRLVVISPGFQETGRNFYEQIHLMNLEGDDVIVMDHQWAGYSDGSPGGLDRGFGVARDVAAVAAFAHEVAPDEKLVLFGNSMGAGPGVLGAATLNDHGKIQLDGPPMPRGVPLVLQAPFIAMNPSLMNEAFAGVSHVPFVNHLKLPALGLPVLTHDATATAEFANHASAEDIRAQSATMTGANADIATIMGMVKAGQGPTGRVYVLHEKNDPLADSSGSVALGQALGSRARVDIIAGDDHVLEESPSEQGLVLPGLRWATAR